MNMKQYAKLFLHRGLLFGGFGPIVMGVIFWIADATTGALNVSGGQILLSVISTYVLAFVQAGSSVFPQIEHWSVARAFFCQLGLLYLTYVGCYCFNGWLPFEPLVVLIFTVIFAVTFLAIWLSVALSVRAVSRRCNKALKR